MRAALRRLGIKLAVLYVIYAIAMVWLHPSFIYPFVQDQFQGRGYETLNLAVPGEDTLSVPVAAGRADRPLVLYFMGNVGAIERFRGVLSYHRNQGRGVAVLPYRGAGGVPGKSSEAGLKRDALATFDLLKEQFPDRKIILHGFSLGAGLALHVAARRDVTGVILSAPYEKLCRLMTRASWLPACWLPVQRWDLLDDAANVLAPVLILHGEADQLIPPSESARLQRHLVKAEVSRRIIGGAGHNNLLSYAPYLQGLESFAGR